MVTSTKPAGSSDDDSGEASKQDSKQNNTPNASGVYDENNNPMETQNESFAGTTTAGAANAAKIGGFERGVTTGELPGMRLFNPLSKLSSYTYQITLYMITPEAYRAFIESGRTKINAITSAVNIQAANIIEDSSAGAYIIAQSGGSNNDGNNKGFSTDFYIDELKIKTLINGKATQTASNDAEISFNIYEPYGFSLITQLTRAGNLLRSKSKIPNYSKLVNASRQFFILGIRFQGYDEAGQVISADAVNKQDTFNVTGDSGGVFERFFDIYIKEFKFKIDGKLTTYNISAKPIGPGIAFGNKRGRVDKGVEVQGKDIDSALQGPHGLLTILSREQALLTKSGKPTVYKLKYLSDAATSIGNKSIVSIADVVKSRWPMGENIFNVSGVNDSAAVRSVPNSTQRVITFSNSLSIMQAIQAIITQSRYMEDALNTIMVNAEEPDPGPNSPDEKTNPNPKKFKWYNLGAEVKVLDFNDDLKDFTYEITYVIQPYETPYVKSPYLNASGQYYGPHKRYEYWYTGKNSEILSYEQTLNNAFFQAVLSPNGPPTPPPAPLERFSLASTSYDVPNSYGKFTNEDKTGKLDTAKQAQNSVITSLYSPGDYSQAKISILGDPDYLMSESPSTVSSVYRQFYGNGFTISPNGGQVFVEIDFKEGSDYSNEDGVLTANESILFWNYPKQVKNIVKGVSYLVREVVSTLSRGKFTQDLTCSINTFPGLKNKPSEPLADLASDPNTNIGTEGQVRTPGNQGGTGSPSNGGTQSSSNTGYKSDQPISTDNPDGGNQGGNQSNKIPPNTGNEKDDDNIPSPQSSPADQGGRDSDTPDLSSRNRLNANGLGGV